MKLLLFLLFITTLYCGVFAVPNKTCTADYQCGGSPYSGCLGALNILPGIGLNDDTGKLYVMGKFNSSDSKNFGDPYLVSIDLATGEVSAQTQITIEVPEGGGGRSLFSLYTYVPQLNYFYIVINQIGSPILALLNNDGNSYSQIWNFRNVPLQMYFDVANNKTIQADFGINEYNGILTARPANPDDKRIIYRQIATSGLSLQGTDIYVSVFNGTFYRGTTTCTNCSQSDLVKLFQDTDLIQHELTDFLTTPEFIYYSSSQGIFQVPLDGDYVKKRAITGDNVVSFTHSKSGFLYYTTPDSSIKKVSLAGNHPQTTVVLDRSHSLNQCACAHGFTGDTCACNNGQVFWSSQGQPYCYPIDSNGNPSTCWYEYQCQGAPYAFCASSTCMCRPNFSGKNCQTCEGGQVNWDYGIPQCLLVPE